MEKGKGISPGCMVILTKATLPQNVGKIGTAVEVFRNKSPHGRLWTVQFRDKLTTVYQLISNEDIINHHPTTASVVQHPETWMRRLDGDPDDHFGEEDTMKPTSTVGELMKENMDRYGVEA